MLVVRAWGSQDTGRRGRSLSVEGRGIDLGWGGVAGGSGEEPQPRPASDLLCALGELPAGQASVSSSVKWRACPLPPPTRTRGAGVLGTTPFSLVVLVLTQGQRRRVSFQRRPRPTGHLVDAFSSRWGRGRGGVGHRLTLLGARWPSGIPNPWKYRYAAVEQAGQRALVWTGRRKRW